MEKGEGRGAVGRAGLAQQARVQAAAATARTAHQHVAKRCTAVQRNRTLIPMPALMASGTKMMMQTCAVGRDDAAEGQPTGNPAAQAATHSQICVNAESCKLPAPLG